MGFDYALFICEELLEKLLSKNVLTPYFIRDTISLVITKST